jgi:chaperonin GroES
LVKPHAAPEKSRGGIELPEDARERPPIGTVVEVGPVCWAQYYSGNTVIPTNVKEGDVVVLKKHTGNMVFGPEDQPLFLIAEADVLAVMLGAS